MPFQSTRPARGATCAPVADPLRSVFQSTRPARGATGVMLDLWNAMEVSIHAPRTGRDTEIRNSPAPARRFNPRAPHGARRQLL